MTALGTKIFKVSLSDPSSSTARAAKRIVVNAELLRNAKIAAGDVLRITARASSHEVSSCQHNELLAYLFLEDDSPFAIGIAWPSQDLDSSGLFVTLIIFSHCIKHMRCSYPSFISSVANMPSFRRWRSLLDSHVVCGQRR